MKSSSLHTLNADKGLSFFEKPLYLFLNWLNNLLSYTNVDKRINFKPLSMNWKNYLDKTHKESSMARKLSDLFWWTLPWEKINNELGEINIFDTGCGSGGYGVRLIEASNNSVNSYTGVDAKEKATWNEFQSKYKNFKLIKSTSNDVSSFIPKETNLIMTQSAIEHFDEDLLYFEQIKKFVDSSNKPVLQIHVFPAVSTLPLYLFHGLRQYNPRNISKITRMFDDHSLITLILLGRREGRKLHFKYFTWPVLILRKFAKPTFDTSEYELEMTRALVEDGKEAAKSPIFWALIIETRMKEGIFS